MPLQKQDRDGLRYIALTLLWTFTVLLVPVAAGLGIEHPLTMVAYILAGVSPSAIGLLFALRAGGTDPRAFLRRIYRPDYIRPGGYLLVVLFIPSVIALSLLAGFLAASEVPDFTALRQYLGHPFGLLLFALFSLVFGPLAEEIGWRGYLTDCFAHRGPAVYGLCIGIVWALWHLPMFFINGSYQNNLLSAGMLPTAEFFVSTTALGVLLGIFTQRNHQSILFAVLFHFTVNFCGELIGLGPVGELAQALLLSAAAGIVFFAVPEKKEALG